MDKIEYPSISKQPPPEYPQDFPQFPTAPIQQQPEIVKTIQQPIAVGPESCRVACPSCGATVMTRINYNATTKTHLMALLLCCCLCWPCACLPYCMNSCQNANHLCPNCGSFIGTYQS